MVIIIAILGLLKLLSAKRLYLNKAKGNIFYLNYKLNNFKPFAYLLFLSNIPEIIFKFNNLLKGINDFK